MKEFSIEVEHANAFCKLMEAISKIWEYANFEIFAEKMTMRSMDASHVAMVELSLPKSFFKRLKAAEQSNLKIDLLHLVKILKTAGDETLGLISERLSNEVKVVLAHEETFRRAFSIKTYMEDIEEAPDPKLAFNVEFGMNSADLVKIVKSCKLIGDYVTLSYSEQATCITAQTFGDDGSVRIDFDSFKGKPESRGDQEAMYSLEYLVDIMKGAECADQVRVAFSTEMPLRLAFTLRDEGQLTYILSPRVEEEELEEIEANENPVNFLPEEEKE